VDLEIIARGTPGFSGADLENLVNEAALYAARHDRDRLMSFDFEMAKDKVLMGTERRSMFISDREKRTTAYHEAGHTLVAKVLPGADPVHKVTIIPRGRALGLTQQLPTEDRLNLTKEFANNQIAILMGGRIAEEIVFDQQTTGAGQDIETATDLARKMVCEWGMSERLGPLTFGKREEQIFLGREIAQHQDYSEQTAIEIDAEVRRIVMANYERAKKIVLEHLDTLKVIGAALLEHETLDADAIDTLMAGGTLPPRKLPEASTSSPTKQLEAKKDKKPGLFTPAPVPALKEDPEKA
jgi:cell division protease FtsH